MLTTVLLSACAGAALGLSTWDALVGATSRGKQLRILVAGVVGVSAIVIQCHQALSAGDEARQRTVEAIAAEQIANLQRMDGLSRPEEQEKSNLGLPELQSAVVKGALASALLAGKADNELLEVLTLLNERVDDFNKRIRKTNENMWSGRGGSSMEWRHKVKDSPSYRTTKDTAIRLLTLLVAKYNLDPQRSFFGVEGSATPKAIPRN